MNHQNEEDRIMQGTLDMVKICRKSSREEFAHIDQRERKIESKKNYRRNRKHKREGWE